MIKTQKTAEDECISCNLARRNQTVGRQNKKRHDQGRQRKDGEVSKKRKAGAIQGLFSGFDGTHVVIHLEKLICRSRK